MTLKALCRGQLRINTDVIHTVAGILEIHPRTVQRSIKFLINRKWIGYNPVSEIHHIRGFDAIRIIEKIKPRRGYWFSICLIKNLKGFVIAACITDLINRQKTRWGAEARVRKRVRSKQKATASLPLFFPVSTVAMAKIYGISLCTASNYRKVAKNQGFIEIRKNCKRFLPQKLKVDSKHLPLVRKFADDDGYHFAQYGEVWTRGSDMIKTTLQGNKRRFVVGQKSKHYKGA